MDWIDLAEDRDQWKAPVNTVMNILVAWNAGKFSSNCTIGGFSRRAQLREWVIRVFCRLHWQNARLAGASYVSMWCGYNYCSCSVLCTEIWESNVRSSRPVALTTACFSMMSTCSAPPSATYVQNADQHPATFRELFLSLAVVGRYKGQYVDLKFSH
jgi:hypothetical protein